MTLTAAVQLLLSRYGGQRRHRRRHRDVRPRPGRAGGSGRVLRQHRRAASPVDDTATVVREFLSQVRETALEAFAHEKRPFDRVVERLQPGPRHQPHAPVPGHDRAAERDRRPRTAGGLRLSSVTICPGQPPSSTWSSSSYRAMARWALAIEYSTDLFDAGDGGADGRAPAGAAGRDRRRPGPAGGRHRAGHPGRTGPGPGRVERHRPRRSRRARCPSCSRRRRARTPDAAALVAGGGRAQLRRAGHRRPTSWPTSWPPAGRRPGATGSRGPAPRPPSMVTAVLAVLKAGAAYLPLDTRACPPARIAVLLADAAARADRHPTGDLATRPCQRRHPAAVLVDRRPRHRRPRCRPARRPTAPAAGPRPGPAWPTSSTPPAPPASPKASRSRTPDVADLRRPAPVPPAAATSGSCCTPRSPSTPPPTSYGSAAAVRRHSHRSPPPGDLDPATLRATITEAPGRPRCVLTSALFRMVAQDAPGCPGRSTRSHGPAAKRSPPRCPRASSPPAPA